MRVVHHKSGDFEAHMTPRKDEYRSFVVKYRDNEPVVISVTLEDTVKIQIGDWYFEGEIKHIDDKCGHGNVYYNKLMKEYEVNDASVKYCPDCGTKLKYQEEKYIV